MTLVQTVTETGAATANPVRRRDASATDVSIPVEIYQVIFPAKNTDNPHATAPVTVHITDEAQLAKRAVATPASVVSWDSSRLSEACSAVATGTITDTTVCSLISFHRVSY